jgi:hypothetical protein
MFYGCHSPRCHFVSFYSQSMIEFTVALHNTVARKRFLAIHSATFTVDIVGFQTDWQLICMSNAKILLKVFIMSLSIFKLHFNAQRYHMQLYWVQSIATFLMMPENASIIACIVEIWNAFIILQVLLDFLHFTTKATPSVQPAHHIIHVYMLMHLFRIPW